MTDPDQVRLAGYLDVAEELLGPSLEKLNGPLALRLDVGLPWSTALLDQRDLDNYLIPLATRLSRAGTRTLACVWGTKQHSGSYLIGIEQAIPGPPPIPPGPVRMQLCYTVGPARNWLTLWKPTIDALGPILRYTASAGPWSPLGGRIVDLGLHCP